MSEKSDRNSEQLTAPEKFQYKAVVSTVVPVTIVVDVWASSVERAQVAAKAAARWELGQFVAKAETPSKVRAGYNAGPLEVVGILGGPPSEKLSGVPTGPEGS